MKDEQIPSPLSVAIEAAEHFENPLAKSAVFVAVAKARFAAGQFDDAFATVAVIPNRAEKKGVLIDLATDFISVKPQPPAEIIIRIIETLIEVDPASMSAAGRFAQILLEAGNISTALMLINAVKKPFHSDRNRYLFVTKLLETGGKESVNDVQKLLTAFENPDYRDWGRLELCKGLAKWDLLSEAENIADSFSSLQRRSYAFFELSKIVPKDKSATLLKKSSDILEAIPIDEDNAESVAVQLRITGKAAFNAELTESGLQMLEQSEVAAAQIPVLLQRFKVQYLLAKVLRELGQIDSVENYLDTGKAPVLEWTGIQRSELLQWFAEASAKENNVTKIWNAAVREAAKKEPKEVNEFSGAERIVEIIRRFSAPENAAPTGDPQTDAVCLSAEEFEEYYYSPFTIADCNCGS